MTKFSDLNLAPKVLKAVEDVGYETPTPIQAGAIPPALEGRDVLGIAQTGTGKTASFTLPMITLLARGRARARMPRSLVLCPTRELAAQVAENFDLYAKYVKLTKALLIGGVSFKEQDRLIDRGVDVLIATPGRLLDHFERGKLLLTGVQIMVVDEADRMLDMGFIPDIERIFSITPFTKQTLFFSATMAPEIERITSTFLANPARIEVARQATAAENIEQAVVMFRPARRERAASEKRRLLRALIDAEGDSLTNGIIFCNRKVDVDILAKSLKKYGYDAAPIHGDLDQSQRTRTLEGFRNGELRLLVASDVAARGLDIPSVSHVFNFDVPGHAEDYVHRIGRTGRAGREGKAIMICEKRDEKNLAAVEALIKKEIPRIENPLGTPSEEASAAETPGSAPREGEASGEARSKRRRSRGGRRGRGSETRETRGASGGEPSGSGAPPRAEEAPAKAEKGAQRPARKPRPQGSKAEDAAHPEPAAESAEPEAPRKGRGRGGKGGRGREKEKIVGMGDHLPGFIAKSFQDRRSG